MLFRSRIILEGSMQREKPRRPAMTLMRLMALVLFAGAMLHPHPAYAWWNGDWTGRKAITIDTTTATGGDISAPIGTTPVLIRLDTNSNFSFDGANPDGSDLRFIAGDDKTPLAYHIDTYDNLLGQAFIWVAVPDLKPSATTTIYLYYGNKKASTPGDNPKGTFDADTALVYHFAEENAAPRDWTGNNNTGLSAITSNDAAIIGHGMRMDGQKTLQLPASPTLAWAGGNALTWSVWFTEHASQPNAVIYSRTDGTNTVQIGVDAGKPYVTVITPSGTQTSSEGAPVSFGDTAWHQLTVVTGDQISVYVDGALYGTLAAKLPALNTTAYLGGDATTGAAPAIAPAAPRASPAPAAPATPPANGGATAPAAAAAAAAPTTGFIGSIDELEISNTARPLGFIAFAALSQGSAPVAAKLITVGAAEKQASWLSGYLVIILGSVTIDGWVIIGILMIMAVLSWIVMANKIGYVNKIAKANIVFNKQYAKIGSDLTALGTPERESKTLESAPLYRLYKIGAEQITRRFKNNTARTHILSAPSIAAIRASLDAGMVRETQQLNKSIVLLTIAISGGPFLGLLGTVVGVMITFASIAAAGNVNVNAIAPGISAALVATVAGLIVAIPALFGYNYLNTRIRNANSDMLVFIDEFETRLAEEYSTHAYQDPRAAE
jgi:biopolymer transport protein ExbB